MIQQINYEYFYTNADSLINEFDENDFTLYPNPTFGSITLDLRTELNDEIEFAVIDAKGSIVTKVKNNKMINSRTYKRNSIHFFIFCGFLY